MQFRKLPVVVEAIQLPDLDDDASQELLDFLHHNPEQWESGFYGTLVLHTLEGDMEARPGDWIIRGVEGEYYPCKASIFAKTYEAVDV